MKASLSRQLLLGCIFAAMGAAGCQRTLFTPNDPYNESLVRRYWDDDSAKEARAARQRANDMGFGFATGGGDQ